MDMAKKYLRTGMFMMAIMSIISLMVKESILGRPERFIQGSLFKESVTEKACGKLIKKATKGILMKVIISKI